LEAQFQDGRLAENLGRSLTRDLLEPPLSPAGYGRFGRGDLLVTRHLGKFIKPCPGTPNYNCCGLSIFHFGLGCDLGCRYCILAAYLGGEALVLFGNVDEGLAEFEALLSRPPAERPRRFGTGEFTDSLLLDPRSRLAEKLIALTAAHPAVLELKTKTDQVDHLLGLDHRGHTVISFSLNAPRLAAREESRAAPLEARLQAAVKAAAAGYPVGFHFDPLLFHPGWEEGYAQICRRLGETLAGARVAWISLGCFRYLAPLKQVMLARHPGLSIFDAEFIRGGDGKMRYPRPLRIEMYRAVLAGLKRAVGPDPLIYLCMESPRVWRDVFGRDPGTTGLTALLDNRAAELLG
jgi:spore photoproduct lyase